MNDQRLSPDDLLQRVQEEELKKKRGKLKIYLGAAPGVGKTYTMLHDALEKRRHDLDVVVGIVESHGRKDIDMLVNKFEFIPRQAVHYREKTWMELDLAAVLHRQPGLILIDEMAHTNAPGLNHAKRWQDIKEVLERGIDVYTTLNVQHIESMKDDIMQIIHVRIHETVPDSMIEQADTIELVDLPPDELLKRLQEGKVYFPQQAELAVEHFFRMGNLIALRELALRFTAERVGADVLLYRQGEGIKQIWPTQDKILVCVGPRPESLKLIRAAKRMANSLHADWLAVYVDTPFQHSIATRNNAIQNLRLAELLGAEIHVLTGDDIVKAVMDFAREKNVTQIMIRKQIIHRWYSWFRKSLADEMVRYSGEIDVYIMTGERSNVKVHAQVSPSVSPWRAYASAVGIIGGITLLNVILSPFLSIGILILLYVLGAMLVALFGLRGPSILASFLSVFAYDYYFIPPTNSFLFGHAEHFIVIFALLVVTQVTSHLVIMIRRQEELAHINHYEMRALYTLSRQLTTTRGVDALLSLGQRYIESVFHCDVLALLPKNGRIVLHVNAGTSQHIDEKELGIAQWVYEMGQPAGMGTDTLSFSNALYLPLLASRGVVGVLRIQPKTQQLLTPEQMGLLESCLNQLALSLEVDRLQEMDRQKQVKVETERVRQLLLRTISKDLHQPLNKVIEVVGQLKVMKGDNIHKIEREMSDEIEKLMILNNSILQIIQLESKK
jgi:two-component system sensor histidine kinase KdpD